MLLKPNNLLCIFFLLVAPQLFSQTVNPAAVIPLDSNLSANEQLLRYIKPYKFILVGEQHGTQEPLKFVTQLAKVLSQSRRISVGFEIPADELSSDLSKLKETYFFKTCTDGRNSEAYLKTILEISNLNRAEVFFYDATKLQELPNTDSAMFLNIQNQYLKDTSRIIITISGNVHNQLKPYKGAKTMGYFLNSRNRGRILSVNHLFSYGTQYNLTQNSHGLRTITEQSPDVLRTISASPDYFYPDPAHGFSERWNAFLFTTKINASFPVKNE